MPELRTAPENAFPLDTPENTNPLLEQTPWQFVGETAEMYARGKTSNEGAQEDILERAASVALTGETEVRNNIAALFEKNISVESSEYAKELIAEQTEVLRGQAEKIQRMEGFVGQMHGWAEQLLVDFSAQENANTEKTSEQKNVAIAEYAQDVRQAVVDAARAITYQDIKASAVTLGDHGWMHLTQDLRDAITIVSEKRPQDNPITAKEQFMLGLAAAYHDIGYAVPEVSDKQKGGEYKSFDKGHPLNSFVYLAAEADRYKRILGAEDTVALLQIVVNHENPERAHLAKHRKDLSEAFAFADASAAFGPDKLPPIVTQVPEILAYLGAVSMLGSEENFATYIYGQMKEPKGSLDEVKQQFKQQVVDTLKQKVVDEITSSERNLHEDQKQALLNSIDHFGPVSLKYLLGRMSAEASKLRVNEQGQVEISINAGFARHLDNYMPTSTQAASELIVKLFLEESAILELTEEEHKVTRNALIDMVMQNTQPSTELTAKLQDFGITVTVEENNEEENGKVQLISKDVVVISNTYTAISAENTAAYSKVEKSFEEYTNSRDEFVLQHNASI